MSVTNKTCRRCKGSGMIEARLLNRRNLDYVWSVFGCDDCQGKGWRDQAAEDAAGRVYCGTIYRDERPYGETRFKEATPCQ